MEVGSHTPALADHKFRTVEVFCQDRIVVAYTIALVPDMVYGLGFVR